MMADEAIELVASFRPRILLVDWLLKEDKNGLHVAEALRRRDKSAGIIFLTGLPTDRVAAQAVTVSPFEVMEKPCDFTLLMKTVEEMLQPDSVKP